MASVEELTGRMDTSDVRLWRDVKKGYTRFQEGDLLFAKITPCMENGKAAIACGLASGAGAGSTEFHVLRPGPALQPKFLLQYVLREEFRKAARSQMTGTAGQLRVPSRFLDAQTIPLPPVPEQRRIVSAIESYFTRLDEAVVSLERVQRNLKRYRASVLKAAVEGRLVPTEAELARAEGRSYEPASVLLERILAERRRRWEEGELAKMKASGKAPKDNRWKAKYAEPVALDTTDLPELPEGWCWVDLALVKEFSMYGPRFSSDDYSDTGQLVLRTSDISESGKVNVTTAPKILLDHDEFQKYRAVRGDLLITRTGSLGTLAVFDDDVEAIPGAYLIQYRIAGPEVLSWFCFYVFKSPNGQTHLARGGAGVGRPNLNAPTIESLAFGMPPLEEQSRIIAELNRLLSITDSLSQECKGSQQRCTRLRQSILRWAFEGRLVDQDQTDEPASVLLERIRAERESGIDKSTRSPRRAKATSTKQ